MRWVQDQLHDVIGMSNKTMAEFMISLAKRSKSSDQLAQRLQSEFNFTAGAKTSGFSTELFSRIKPGSSSSSSKKKSKRSSGPSNKDLLERSRQFSMVGDEDADEDEQLLASIRARRKRKLEKKEKKRAEKKKKNAKHARRRGHSDDDDDDETVIKRRADIKAEEDAEAAAKAAEADDELRKEIEREKDMREKEEFEARLKAKDEARTKRLMKDMSKDERVSSLSRVTAEEQARYVPKLREFSRAEYVAKREEKERKLLQYQIEDEQFLFDNEDLTEEERRRHLALKEVYDITTRQRKELDKDDGYQIPTAYETEDGKIDKDRKLEALKTRYLEDEKEVVHDQDLWESNQAAFAKFRPGAKDTQKEQGAEYDYVFEDQIDFVTGQMIKGAEVHKVGGEKAEPTREEVKLSLDEVRKTLPIFAYRQQLLDVIRDNQVVVVVGETGSGKTTQIPQYLHEAGYTTPGTRDKPAIKVGCTQPRRVAAMSVAARVAQEVGVKLGNEVGYQIRFEDSTSERTLIKYMTDGMLLREFLAEPDLASYSAIMVDEAHERTLHTDVLFGLVKDIVRFRDDIKLIIASATMDAEKFSVYFDDCPVFLIPGRMYPVDILYTKAPEADYLDAAVVTVLQTHINQPTPGDILVFFTGQEEIETAEQILKLRTQALGSKIKELIICPIYATLPSERQAEIFEPTPEGARKVVLATNIAETSLTIDGISYVIDTGFSKQTSYNPRTGMESLIVTPISKAGAVQRSGRAGRTGPGKCFRLYTAWSFKHELPDNQVPEIQRTNLASVVLMLKSLGINDLIHFDFMDPPPPETLIKSLEELYALGALNDRGDLTKLGRRMAEFPCNPMLSKTILSSEKYKCVEEILTMCCMLDVNNSVFYRPKDKAVHADNAKQNFARGGHGDHFALMNVYTEWMQTNYSRQWCFENFVQDKSLKRARDIRDQFVDLCERVEIELVSNASDMENIAKAITAGYFYNTAKLQKDGSYRTIKNPHNVSIHPTSTLFKQDEHLPRWVLYHELVYTSKEFMRQVIVIKPDWLVELAPHYYKNEDIKDSSTIKMPKGKGKSTLDPKSEAAASK